MPATYYIHVGLQWKMGDHTTLQELILSTWQLNFKSKCSSSALHILSII